jgi:hypothetical protein
MSGFAEPGGTTAPATVLPSSVLVPSRSARAFRGTDQRHGRDQQCHLRIRPKSLFRSARRPLAGCADAAPAANAQTSKEATKFPVS